MAKPDAATALARRFCHALAEETAGMNKICYYNCLGSLAAITLGFADICPMSINR